MAHFGLSAQNDARLYNTWNQGNGVSWSFSARPGDNVDEGIFRHEMPPTSINAHCACQVTRYVNFEWNSSNGKVSMHFDLSEAYVTVTVIGMAAASKEEKAEADLNCPINANAAFDEYKRTFQTEQEHAYSIIGNTLNLGATSLIAKFPISEPIAGDNAGMRDGEKSIVKNGFHTFSWENGSHYEGNWMNDQRHGVGTFTSENGNVYRGEWANDLKHGKGTLTYADGRVYTGDFENDAATGQGTMTDKEGDRYEGKWLNYNKEGQGVYKWSDGNMYTGQWKSNQMNGYGTYNWKDGRSYTGQWKDGKMEGVGTFTDQNGVKKTGKFQNNAFVE